MEVKIVLKFVNIDGLANQNTGDAKTHGIFKYIQRHEPMKWSHFIRAIF